MASLPSWKRTVLRLHLQSVKNPLDSTAAVVADGKILYEMYCDHCHGAKGEGNGKVSEKYNGVPNYKSDALKSITEGHIFHVITHGKGLNVGSWFTNQSGRSLEDCQVC